VTDAHTTAPDTSAPVPLLEPREGIPAVVASASALASVIAAFAAGAGPVAVDAERASGYRYGQRAYLIQLRRAGAGTALIDPVACPDLSELGEVLRDTEWVLHAASQDLPCLAGVGMRPVQLFDTELAGRLAGFARVGLGPMVENVLGFSLEKGHSAVDWSTRPLPEPWLRYAALDVEVLVELRDALEQELRAQDKLGWALEEFAAIAVARPPAPRTDPWRRTSGLHRVRKRRQLAIVRALWEARDQIARERDLSPGRVLQDAAIIEAALAAPASVAALVALPVFSGRTNRKYADVWFAAVEQARSLGDEELPAPVAPHEGPPPTRSWNEKDPQAAARLLAARAAVAAVADEHTLPTENLLTPDTVRRLCWSPPDDLAEPTIADVLRRHGAREWQVRLTAPVLAGALTRLNTRALET
jgi:ribonuclease D